MSSEHLIFVGFEMTAAVSSLLKECSDRDKVYLEDPAFLEIVTIDDHQYVGKRVKEGIAIDRVEDTARSVVSLLTRVNDKWVLGAAKALVLAAEESPQQGHQNEIVGFDYSELVD
jgi:hypothetical protein